MPATNVIAQLDRPEKPQELRFNLHSPLRTCMAHEEIAAQVRKIVATGIRPSHLDTHKHTHLLPPVAGSREIELAALLSPRTRQIVEQRGILLVNYRQI